MTSDKIISIFENVYENPITLNTWMRFPDAVSIITSKQNMNIYIDKTQLFYISSSDESLYISIKKSYKELDDENIEDEYPITVIIPLDTITGFITTSYQTGLGVYNTKPF